MRYLIKIWLLLTISTGITPSQNKSDSGDNRYAEFNQNFQNQVSQAELRLAKLHKLKSIPREYPTLAKLAVETHSSEIDELVSNDNSFFPTITTVSIVKNIVKNKIADKKIIVSLPLLPSLHKYGWTAGALYKKGNDLSRIITALEMRKAIKLNNLQHLAIANKSFVKDAKSGWIVVAQGVAGSKLVSVKEDCTIANSLTVDEIKDLITFAEETGFMDWSFDNINMVRDKNNNNKLTIIDTERRFLWKKIEKLKIVMEMKKRLGIHNLEKMEKVNSTQFQNNGLHAKPEVRNYIDNRIASLSLQDPQCINSLLDENNKYQISGLELKKIEQEFRAMNYYHHEHGKI